MKLFDCLDIANACCIEYIDDAYDNIDRNCPSLFGYDVCNQEMLALYTEYVKYGFTDTAGKIQHISIDTALNRINNMDGTNLKFSEVGE